jgi:hypothetical protein
VKKSSSVISRRGKQENNASLTAGHEQYNMEARNTDLKGYYREG